jgi:hypothetical protein
LRAGAVAAARVCGFGVFVYRRSARNGGPFDPELLIPHCLIILALAGF